MFYLLTPAKSSFKISKLFQLKLNLVMPLHVSNTRFSGVSEKSMINLILLEYKIRTRPYRIKFKVRYCVLTYGSKTSMSGEQKLCMTFKCFFFFYTFTLSLYLHY